MNKGPSTGGGFDKHRSGAAVTDGRDGQARACCCVARGRETLACSPQTHLLQAQPPNVIALYHNAYNNAAGAATAFWIPGGNLGGHAMEYIGIIDGNENVPIYRRTVNGGNRLYAGGLDTAHLYHLAQVTSYAQLPAVGQPMYCWWHAHEGFAAGFYEVVRQQ